jgi:hypothetical protein
MEHAVARAASTRLGESLQGRDVLDNVGGVIERPGLSECSSSGRNE